MELDTYLTVKEQSLGLYKDKGSKFIAIASPVSSEDEVKEILQNLRKEYHDARHHCYAYVFGFKGENWRVNDDGEPSSTAGRPIYGQMISRNLTNTLIVVVRYFGGTKLGVSGLINAYKTAASDALENAQIITKTVNEIFQVKFDYTVMNDVMKLIKDEDLKIIEQHFDTRCMIVMSVRQGKRDLVADKVFKIDSVESEILRTE